MNPYSAPQSDLEDAGVEDCWREGKVFVMKRDSLFPRRCVKCNGDAQRPVRSRRIFWLHPGWYAVFPVNLLMYFFLAPIFPLIGAFVLPNILLYVIFIAIVRKKASIEPGLCAKHARTRNLFLGLGSFMFVVSGMAVLSVALGRSTTDLTGYGALGMIVADGDHVIRLAYREAGAHLIRTNSPQGLQRTIFGRTRSASTP